MMMILNKTHSTMKLTIFVESTNEKMSIVSSLPFIALEIQIRNNTDYSYTKLNSKNL